MPKHFRTQVKKKHVEQINTAVERWENGMTTFFRRFTSEADAFRMEPPTVRTGGTGMTNTRVAETLRATEAIATTWQRMMTLADPWWELVRAGTGFSDGQLYTTEQGLWAQIRASKYKRKLLRGLRSTALFGTGVWFEPRVLGKPGALSNLEYTDFNPISLLQFAFDTNAHDIEESDFYATIDFLSPHKLKQMARQAPDTWDGKVIERVLANSGGGRRVREEIINRRQRAGYSDQLTGVDTLVEVITYYGPLEGLETEDERDWVVTILNGTEVVRAHPNPRTWRPFRITSFVDFELEPLGYGVGKMGHLAQRQMDNNRNRVHDTITLGLLNMWLKNRNAGIHKNAFRIRPNGVIEADDTSDAALRPLRPLLEAASHGLALDSVLKGEFQGATGATPNLQAVTTGASATESSIAQNEGIRRMSVHAEIMSDEVVRDHLMAMHKDNLLFMGDEDPAFRLAGTKKDGPVEFQRRQLAEEIDFTVKTVTDKDFRPKRVSEMTAFATQVLLPLVDKFPADIDPIPFLQEQAKALGVNPELVIRKLDDENKNLPIMSDKLNSRADQAAQLGEAIGGANVPEGIDPRDIGGGGPGSAFEEPLGEVANV